MQIDSADGVFVLGSLVRDEGLSDSILFAVEPMSLPLQNS